MATKKTTNAVEVKAAEKDEKIIPFNYTITPDMQEAVIVLEQAVTVAQQRGVYTINDAFNSIYLVRAHHKNFSFCLY